MCVRVCMLMLVRVWWSEDNPGCRALPHVFHCFVYPRLAGSPTLVSPILSHHRSADSHSMATSDFTWGFELAFLNELFLLGQEHLLCSMYSKPKALGCGAMGHTGRQWELWARR